MLYFNVTMYLQWNFEINLLSKSKVLLSSIAIFFIDLASTLTPIKRANSISLE